MSSINTNTMATIASNSLTRNERTMNTSMERLSTGLRINTAKDDAAGLAIAAKMTSQIRGLDQAVRNANDAISLIQTAEGALVEVSNMLQRMRELAVQSATDTNNTTDRTALNAEFVALRDEINRVAQNTQWNGSNVLDKSFAGTGGAGMYKFQVGANAAQTIDLTIGNYQTNSLDQEITAAVNTTTEASGPGVSPAVAQISTLTLGQTAADGNVAGLGDIISVSVGDKSYVHTVTAGAATAAQTLDEIGIAIAAGLGDVTGVTVTEASGVLTFTGTAATAGTPFAVSTSQAGLLGGIRQSSVTTQANANSAMAAVTTALATVNTGRSEMGATMNRLQYAADNLTNVSANAQASRSRIEDADYAAETTELARTQIISQAGTAMLAQANQAKQSVLALLK
jgi:flagellin